MSPPDRSGTEAGPAREAKEYMCPLCGMRFTSGGRGCSACPLHGGCDIVCCPRCGHQFPEESKLVALARRWYRRGRGEPP
jgi:hypothetical protein